MSWKIVSSRVQGDSHKKHKIPCQDYVEYFHENGLLIGAIADGSSSAKYSKYGAQLAVKHAIDYVKENSKCPLTSKKKHRNFLKNFCSKLDKILNQNLIKKLVL